MEGAAPTIAVPSVESVSPPNAENLHLGEASQEAETPALELQEIDSQDGSEDKVSSGKGKGKERAVSEGSQVEDIAVGSSSRGVVPVTVDSVDSIRALQGAPEEDGEGSDYFGHSTLSTRNLPPSSSTPIIHPRPLRPPQQFPQIHSIPSSSSAHPPTPSPLPKRKRRFSRSLSQLSLSSLKSLSRPGTPSRTGSSTPSSPLRGELLDYDGQESPREKGKTKAKLRELFRFEADKIPPPRSRSSTIVPVQAENRRPSLPSLDRVRSRGRSNSAPSLFNSPRSPLQPVAWKHASPGVSSPPFHSAHSTPFHSATSSPLSVYFPFSPELDPRKPEVNRDAFAHYLPFELQIRIMKALLEVCEDDWRREVREGSWKGVKARQRWNDGEARGRRELARIARVSKSWRKLSLDGQLWTLGPATSVIGAEALSLQSTVSLFRESGSFVKKLDLAGYGKSMNSRILDKIIEGASRDGYTNLTSINLRGCNSISSHSITDLLSCSPHLSDLDLFALPQIVATLLDVVAIHCRRITSLNVSRCRNLSASSLLALNDLSPESALRQLMVSALPDMTNDIVFDIFTKHPKLESLDISFSPHLADEAFKRIAGISSPDHPVTSYPWLKSLNLTGCTSLTSLSLSYFTLPRTGSLSTSTSLLPSLQKLQLSRLSPSFDVPNHLSTFLESIKPTLTKLDLEDGVNLTDRVLTSLLGSEKLETLILNSCSTFTDQGILEMIRGCKKLRILEVDGTEISDATAKEYVRLVKERQVEDNAEERRRVGPLVLSILDNRLTGRRLHREVGNSSVRPRIGHRGYWTGAAVGFYHDGSEEGDEMGDGESTRWKNRLEECEEDKIVVRSFYSSLEVDAANAVRKAREEKKVKAKEPKGGLLRVRALSDSVLLANGGRGGGRDGEYEGGGVGLGLSSSTGCIVM